MTQRNVSSYLPIIYILLVVFSIFLMELSEEVGRYYHLQEMKSIDLANKTVQKKKSKIEKKKEAVVIPIDSTSKKVQKEVIKVDTVENKTLSKNSQQFFSDLAKTYKSKIGKSDSDIASRTDMVIRYYKKNKDKERVYALRNLGFYIHERPAEKEFEDYFSNAIFYGDSVKREDLFLIAYTLLENGVKLQSMTLSKYHDAWKAHSVEIGTDTTMLNKPSLTINSLFKKWDEF